MCYGYLYGKEIMLEIKWLVERFRHLWSKLEIDLDFEHS